MRKTTVIILISILILGNFLPLISLNQPSNAESTSYIIERGENYIVIYNPATNRYTMKAYNTPINYYNNYSKSWEPITYSFYNLNENDTAYKYGYRFGTRAVTFNAYFKSNITDNFPISLTYQRRHNLHTLRQEIIACGYVEKNDFDYVVLQKTKPSVGYLEDSNTMRYDNIFTGVNVTWDYSELGIKENITLSSAIHDAMTAHPPSSFGLSNANSYFIIASKLDYGSYKIYINNSLATGNITVDNTLTVRDAFNNVIFSLPIGKAIDSNNSSVDVKYKLVGLGGDWYLLYAIPVTWLASAQFPITIDPTTTVYSETSDGYVGAYSGSWSDCRSKSSGNSVSDDIGSYWSIEASYSDSLSRYDIIRSFLMFDTSSIPDNVTVTNVYLNVYGYGNSDSDVCAMKGTQGDTLETEDFDAFEGSEYGHVNWVIDMYNNISFNAQGCSDINKTGVTYICLREYSHDYLNNTPSIEYKNGLYFADNTGTDKDPYLVIVYVTNSPPTQSNESPTNGATGVSTSPTLAITVSDAEGDIMNITWRTNASGTWQTIGTNLSVSNGTYYCSNTSSMSSYATTYYWSVNLTDGTSWTNTTYYFTTSTIPVIISDESPTNGSTDQTINPQLSVTIINTEGRTMNISFYTNATGSWTEIGTTDTSVGNGTYTRTPTDMSLYVTTYYWSVNVTDGSGWLNETYHFTTASNPVIISDVSPSNGATNQTLNPTLSTNITHPYGNSMNISFYTNASGSWVEIGTTNSSAGNGTYSRTPTTMSSYGTTYYWSINVSDGIGWKNVTYHFTTYEMPTINLTSPANGSTNVSYSSGATLTWIATPSYQSLTYCIYFGTSNTSMNLVSMNQTSTSYSTGSLDEDTTYYWQIVAWNEYGLSNSSEIFHFTTNVKMYSYRVFLRNEEDFEYHDIDLNATYTLKVHWSDLELTYSYNITQNGSSGGNWYNYTTMPTYMRLYINAPIYNYSNPSIIDSYVYYYRTYIPFNNSENVTFWLSKNPQNLIRYTYSIEDKTGSFAPPVILRFFIYNETKGVTAIIDEDWLSADNSLGVYLLYNNRYSLYVLNGEQPPTSAYNAGFTDADAVISKTISIYLIPSNPSGWESITYDAYKYESNSIYIYFEDSEKTVNWINITIYEYVNGSLVVLDNTNASTYTFTWLRSGVNLSRYHEVNFTFYYEGTGSIQTLRIAIPENVKPLMDYTTIDAIIVNILGDNPFGWFASFMGAMVLVVSFTFSPKYQGLTQLAMGLLLLFIVVYFSASALLPTSLLTFLILMGVLQIYYERKREGGGL